MKPQPPRPQPPRLYGVYRHSDVNGGSGTGIAAWAVQWPDGRATSWWAASHAGVNQISMWNGLHEISKVHGHGGRTVVVSLGTAAAVEQLDTQPHRARLRSYEAAAAGARPGDVEHIAAAFACMAHLPELLDAHDRLAAAYAAQTAELEQLRAEHQAMQDALDAIADTAT